MSDTLVRSVCGMLEAIADEVSRPHPITTQFEAMRWVRLWKLRSALLRWLKD